MIMLGACSTSLWPHQAAGHECWPLPFPYSPEPRALQQLTPLWEAPHPGLETSSSPRDGGKLPPRHGCKERKQSRVPFYRLLFPNLALP